MIIRRTTAQAFLLGIITRAAFCLIGRTILRRTFIIGLCAGNYAVNLIIALSARSFRITGRNLFRCALIIRSITAQAFLLGIVTFTAARLIGRTILRRTFIISIFARHKFGLIVAIAARCRGVTFRNLFRSAGIIRRTTAQALLFGIITRAAFCLIVRAVIDRTFILFHIAGHTSIFGSVIAVAATCLITGTSIGRAFILFGIAGHTGIFGDMIAGAATRHISGTGIGCAFIHFCTAGHAGIGSGIITGWATLNIAGAGIYFALFIQSCSRFTGVAGFDITRRALSGIVSAFIGGFAISPGPSARAGASVAGLRAAVLTGYFFVAFAVILYITAGAVIAFEFFGFAALASCSLRITGRTFGIIVAGAGIGFAFHHFFVAGLTGFTGGRITARAFGIFIRTRLCGLAQISGPAGFACTFIAGLRTAVFTS